MTNATDFFPFMPQAERLHSSMFTLDSHCDTPRMLTIQGWDIGVRHQGGTLLGGDLDLVRMKEGGLASVFMAVFVSQGPCTTEGHKAAGHQADNLLARLDALFAAHPELCERALSPEEARHIYRAGKRAIFLGMENGYPIGRDLSRLDAYYERGIRYLTLCHASDNDLCAACTAMTDSTMVSRASADTGLTAFGVQVVERMNQLGMIVDVSHTSRKTVEDVLRISQTPVIASHSGAKAVADHPRNLDDDQLKAIAAKGGVVQVLFVPWFLNPGISDPKADQAAHELMSRVDTHYADHAIGANPAEDLAFEREYQDLIARFPPPPVTVGDVVDHIDHIVKIAGIDHVGIGSDFDGGGRLTDCLDVSQFPRITAELLRRGYTETDIRKIWGENLLRVFDQVIACASATKV